MTNATTLQTALISSLIAGASLGMLIHDTSVDKATVTALTAPTLIAITTVQLGGDPHTHSERGSLYQAIRELRLSQPRMQPQWLTDRKHTQTRPSTSGHYPFDDESLARLITS